MGIYASESLAAARLPCCRFRENGAYAAEALKAVAGEALRSSGVN